MSEQSERTEQSESQKKTTKNFLTTELSELPRIIHVLKIVWQQEHSERARAFWVNQSILYEKGLTQWERSTTPRSVWLQIVLITQKGLMLRNLRLKQVWSLHTFLGPSDMSWLEDSHFPKHVCVSDKSCLQTSLANSAKFESENLGRLKRFSLAGGDSECQNQHYN